jgi:hypothetical protein
VISAKHRLSFAIVDLIRLVGGGDGARDQGRSNGGGEVPTLLPPLLPATIFVIILNTKFATQPFDIVGERGGNRTHDPLIKSQLGTDFRDPSPKPRKT